MVISITDFRPRPRYDGNAWTSARMEGRVLDTDDWSTVDSFTFDDPDTDPTQPKARSFTAEDVPSDTQWLRMVFLDDLTGEDVTDPISVTPLAGALTTLRDVRLRRGEGDLDAEEELQAQAMIMLATISIYASLGRPSSWIPTPDQRALLNMMATELVVRSMQNPLGLDGESERIGTYSYTRTYSQRGIAAPSLMLSDVEEMMIRRAVYGSNIASVAVLGPADAYADLMWPRWQWEWTMYYGGLEQVGDYWK